MASAARAQSARTGIGLTRPRSQGRVPPLPGVEMWWGCRASRRRRSPRRCTLCGYHNDGATAIHPARAMAGRVRRVSSRPPRGGTARLGGPRRRAKGQRRPVTQTPTVPPTATIPNTASGTLPTTRATTVAVTAAANVAVTSTARRRERRGSSRSTNRGSSARSAASISANLRCSLSLSMTTLRSIPSRPTPAAPIHPTPVHETWPRVLRPAVSGTSRTLRLSPHLPNTASWLPADVLLGSVG